MSSEIAKTIEAAANVRLEKGLVPSYVKTPSVTGKALYDPADIKALQQAGLIGRHA